MQGLTIRPARPQDAPAACRLIYSTGPGSFDLAFGSTDRAISAIARLFIKTANLTSYRYTRVAEFKNRVVGILIIYDGDIERQIKITTGLNLISILGPLYILFHLTILLRQNILNQGPLPHEMYIADIAVEPGYQGKGIGKLLMKKAEDTALKKGCTAVSLNVRRDNLSAIKFYARLGYRCTQEWIDPWLKRRYGHPGVLRMSKSIRSI